MASNNKYNLFTIPPTESFSDSFVRTILKETEKNRSELTKYLILLPTRRACRVIRDAFLRQTNGTPILLPRLQAIGDIDEGELFFNLNGEDSLDCKPPISSMKRQAYLAQIISKLPDFSKSPAHNISLANALGQLLDQIYTEDLDISELPSLVDSQKFAAHWQITLDFLKIISEYWPQILNEIGMIDAADRRNILSNKLNDTWISNPPNHPIIAAGTTGSIPSTAKLLKTILTLPNGRIVLPGIDTYMSNNAWDNIDETHPQATLKNLLISLEKDRNDIKIWGCVDDNTETIKEKFISDALIPAKNSDIWQSMKGSEKTKQEIITSLVNTHLYECDTSQEEATIISLIIRESLEHKEKITAVVTPDRQLAKRIAVSCERWGIQLDDSAGKNLEQTTIGSFLISSAEVCLNQISPVYLLSFLKHPLNTGGDFKNFRKHIRLLDKQVLRGLKPDSGFKGIIKKYNKILDDEYQNNPNPINFEFINYLENLFKEFYNLFHNNQPHDFKKYLTEHIKFIENCSKEEFLWSGEEGEEASKFLSELLEASPLLPKVKGSDYLLILKQLMKQKSVRPKYGTHPRLMILGQLEARLINADRVILSSLNEGKWPSDSKHDPWMSRPMRQDFGLPPLERSIGLSAHDFVQGFCKKEVFLTRSKKQDGSPTVPSRWLQRISTLLKAYDISEDIIKKNEFNEYKNQLNLAKNKISIKRPEPTPPINVRPTNISVTSIDTWLKDPYSIYAKYILKIKNIDPLEKEWSHIEKGNLLHKILEKFNKDNKSIITNDCIDKFITIAKDEFELNGNEAIKDFWLPKIYKIGKWYINHETSWRKQARPIAFEEKGFIEINKENINFTIFGRVDRIDKLNNGEYVIIDYKSGGSFSAKGIQNGQYTQLPLEGYILKENGLKSLNKKIDNNVSNLEYWVLNGSDPAGKIVSLNKESDIKQAIESAEIGIKSLINVFYNQQTPYYSIPNLDNAPRFNDYEHLARVKEWTALSEQESIS